MSTEPSFQQDRFAELLSEGFTIPQIRKHLGLNNNQAQGLMKKIRRRLGWQAV